MTSIVSEQLSEQPNIDIVGLEWTRESQLKILTDLESIAEAQLFKLKSVNGAFLWASDSPNFKFAFFGRDTATVVENLASRPEHHEQCCEWLASLARYQGEKTNTISDERFGAFPHEIRSLYMEGQEIDDKAEELFYALRPRWSESPETETIVYYGELDGPARFIRACAALIRNGVDISQKTYTHMGGEQRNLLDACNLAIRYIKDRIDESDFDLVELQPPENIETLTNQTLKDSLPAYLHKLDGKPVLPNRNAPRAPLEAQLLSYEALVEYADIVVGVKPDEANDLHAVAASLKAGVLKHFLVTTNALGAPNQWPYLASMLDRSPDTGEPRLLNTRMSDVAEGLYGSFFDGENPLFAEMRHSITRDITSGDFLTDGGVRCRALSDHGLFDFAEYHGSLPSWIVVTHAVAKGQLRQGYPRIAQELWTRMLCVMIVVGRFQEFCYFDEQGRLLIPEGDDTGVAEWILYAEEDSQKNQAWSITAALEAIQIIKNTDLETTLLAERAFEDEILSTMPQYRHDPSELISRLRQNMQVYRLEQVRQRAGAHEVDIIAATGNNQVLRPVA